MKHFLKTAIFSAVVSTLPMTGLAQDAQLPTSDLSDTSLNAVLSRFVSEEEANQLADSLQRLWESKTEDEQGELKSLAQAYLAGDEDAGKRLADHLNLQQNDVSDRSVAVGLIVIGIGIMML